MRTYLQKILCAGAPLYLLGLVGPGCKKEEPTPPDQMSPPLAFSRIDAQIRTADLMRAAIEMQFSGEPLAEAMGRTLDGYDRSLAVTDQYQPSGDVAAVIDLAGYSTAVESYEYSKIMMNTVSFESGPGLSMMYGPLINSAAPMATGDAAVGLLRSRVQALALASRAGVDDKGPWVIVPAPTGNPLNLLGFPGLWPQFAEFESFAPDMEPSGNVLRGCSLTGGYGGSAGMTVSAGDYECGYNTLHVNRGSGEKLMTLDAMGFSAWKQALWVVNYFQLVHDVDGTGLTNVDAADSAQVGVTGNTVAADDGPGTGKGKPGTYLGASDLEGFQGLLMTEQLDNKAEFLLKNVAGFSSLLNALSYDYTTPPRVLPHRFAVTEQAGTGSADPQPGPVSIKDDSSMLADLSGLIGAYAETFALTDLRNADVGGSSTVRPVFDGNPFAQDDGMPDGDPTLHDRALAVLKVALVNLDRLHSDASGGVLVDSVRLQGGNPVRMRHATTVEITQAIVSLRRAYRALTAQLTLYGNDTPDTMINTTALDGTSLAGVPGGVALSVRLQQIIKAQADFLASKLVGTDGLAKNGYDLAADSADSAATTVESQAAAVRGLLEAYLSTSQVSYRDKAEAAYAALEQRFFDGSLRTYRTTLTDDTTFTWTPLRFGSVQAALRQMYLLVGARPGNEPLASQLQTRLARLNKLVLNGWDDRNDDGKVDYPGECLRVESTLPRGGLLLGERALTGELGKESGAFTADRDRDCVPEVDDAKLAALLAKELVLVKK
jgi:hypothetical protein